MQVKGPKSRFCPGTLFSQTSREVLTTLVSGLTDTQRGTTNVVQPFPTLLSPMVTAPPCPHTYGRTNSADSLSLVARRIAWNCSRLISSNNTLVHFDGRFLLGLLVNRVVCVRASYSRYYGHVFCYSHPSICYIYVFISFFHRQTSISVSN